MTTEAYPKNVLDQTVWWLQRFRSDFLGELPLRIHSSEIADDGSPQWHPDFARWLTARENTGYRPPTNSENRLRTTRALRRLRKVAIREFEVVYRVMVLGESLEATTKWLNARAQRNRIPLPPGRSMHYTLKDTSCILFSGIDKMRDWWG